jgi:hypothetical protein
MDQTEPEYGAALEPRSADPLDKRRSAPEPRPESRRRRAATGLRSAKRRRSAESLCYVEQGRRAAPDVRATASVHKRIVPDIALRLLRLITGRVVRA